MSFEINKPQVISYEYDFSVDGGAVGTLTLRSTGPNQLAPGLIVTKAILNVATAVTSGTGTAVVGDADDDDGYLLNVVAAAAGAYSSMSARGGAYLRSSAADIESELVKRVLAGKPVTMTIATGAVTAGKFKVDFHCYQA
jgi:hypothetical protein